MSNLVIINFAIYHFVSSYSVVSVGKIVALLQVLVCALALFRLQMCHNVRSLSKSFLSAQ